MQGWVPIEEDPKPFTDSEYHCVMHKIHKSIVFGVFMLWFYLNANFQIDANNDVINESWDENEKSKNVADSVGLMVYEGTQSLKFVKNFNNAADQWEGSILIFYYFGRFCALTYDWLFIYI